MRAPFLHFALVLFLAAPTGEGNGQQPPAVIPTDLALALIDNGGGMSMSGNRPPRIVVGRAPDGMPASLTSAEGGTVIGGIEYPDRATVVLAFTLPPNQVLLGFERLLASRGWTRPPQPTEDRGGFVASASSYAPFWGDVYCADSGSAQVSFVPAAGGGTYLKVQHIREKARGGCGPSRIMSAYIETLKFPTLVPPVGMSQRGSGGCGGGGSNEISAHFVGPLEPSDALAHYAKQLQAAGWRIGAPLGNATVTLASAEAKDSDSKAWTGTLMVTRVSPSELEVTIRMARPSVR